MASAQQKFWKLTIDSRLLALDECQRLHAEFVQVSSAPPDDAAALAKWLVKEGILSRYQARVLLSGRAGPFWLGEYKILDRHGDGQIKGLYEALCRSTGERVLLFVVPGAKGQDLTTLQALARKVQKAVAGAVDSLTQTVSFAEQGSLAFGVVGEFSPSVAADEPIAPDVPEEPSPEWAADIPLVRPRIKRRRMTSALVGWGVGLVLLLAAGGVWLTFEPGGANVSPEPQTALPAAANEPELPEESPATDTAAAESPRMAEEQVALGVGAPRGSAGPTIELVDDDGQALWASPTSGSPLNLSHLPAGAQAVLVLRPAELVANAEGAKMLAAIGPASATAAEEIHAITFCQWAEIEQLQIAFYSADSGPVRTAFAVRLAPSVTTEVWTERLSNPTSAKHGDKQFFQAGDRAYYLPESEGGRLVVIASAAEIEELIDATAPRMTKEMERLLADTDGDRHFTLVTEPYSMFNGSQKIFVGELARIAQPLRRFLGTGVQAALVSGHVDRDLFLELRVYGQADKDPRQLAAHYRAELAELPARFEAYLATLDPQPYGRAILLRFPRMLGELQRFTRSAAEHHEAVLRCYLPAAAGHNLLMGAELALAERPKSGGAAGKEGGKKSADIEAALAKRVSLSFPRDTLEKSLEMLSTEIGVEIVILGSDLQLEGITKNQSFGLDERDQPAVEILNKILKLANSDGKLIYVIKPRSGGGDPILFVTTRAAAKKRGDPLPAGDEKK